MSESEPTNAEILAAAVGIQFVARDLTERTDRTSYRDTCETLDALHEGAALAGEILPQLRAGLVEQRVVFAYGYPRKIGKMALPFEPQAAQADSGGRQRDAAQFRVDTAQGRRGGVWLMG